MKEISVLVNECLISLNVCAGDAVLLHSDAKAAVQFGQYSSYEAIGVLISLILDFLGKEEYFNNACFYLQLHLKMKCSID